MVRVAGAWVDPDEYVRVNGQWVRRDPDGPPPPPPPPSTALAMPRGAVNGWGTAADFYDSVGVNIHFDHGGGYASEVNTVADLAELGIRHARDAGHWSWMSYEYYNFRRGIVAIRNRNASLPAPSSTDRGQPIFLQLHAPGWGHPSNLTGPFGYPPNTGYEPAPGAAPTVHWTFTMSRPYAAVEWFYGMDGGSNGWGHYPGQSGAPRNMPASHDNSLGFRIPDGVTSNPDAVTPNPWDWSDPECPWEIVGGIGVQNEAGLGWRGDHPAHAQMKPWAQALYAIAKNAAHQAKVIGGPPRVTETGIASNIKASQIPMLGVVVMSYGPLVDLYGDMSKGTNVADVGDRHPYQPGVEPSHEWMANFNYGTRAAANFSGSKATPASSTKGLPWFATEIGQTTSNTMPDRGTINAHGGNTWPTPQDVAAEYAVRQFLLHWGFGNIRRTFWYEFVDDTVGGFGFLASNRAKKAPFYAIRNMLRLTGFTEPSQAARVKLPITVTGFPSLPQNTQLDPATNVVWWRTNQQLDVLQTQQDDDTWLLWLIPQRSLWDRMVGNYNAGANTYSAFANVAGGRRNPSTVNLTVTLPSGVTQVEEAQPTRGMTPNPSTSGYSWGNPNDGFAFTNLTMNTSRQVTVALGGYTKVLRITKGAAGTLFTPGIVSGADWTTPGGSADAGLSLGANVMRVEFDPNLNPGSAGADRTFMDGIFDFFADRNIQILMLAGWQGAAGNNATVGQAQHMGEWAQRYGPGGDFWVARGTQGNLASQFIEWGNETNYNYQSGDPNSGGYATIAQTYAQRFQTAWGDIAATGKAVGLLCQGTPTDTTSPVWVNNLFSTVPTIGSLAAGWTVHPYGPDYLNRLTQFVAHLSSHGVTSAAIDITELGIATDNGKALGDNYGWPTNLSYATAAFDLQSVVNGIRNASFGSRVRHFMLYQAKDRQPPGGGSTDKEMYFGGLNNTNGEKGQFSTTFRAIMNET